MTGREETGGGEETGDAVAFFDLARSAGARGGLTLGRRDGVAVAVWVEGDRRSVVEFYGWGDCGYALPAGCGVEPAVGLFRLPRSSLPRSLKRWMLGGEMRRPG